MNKKTFISELEKRLSILIDSERKDIINEYSDIIEEKVKHGETEEAAIASFGSLDELVKEILKAYKINSDYKNSKDSMKNIADDCSNIIGAWAQWLSNITKKAVNEIKTNNKDFTLETAFELVLKFILVLFLLLILRIPFNIIGGMLKGIIGIGFSPFDWFISGIISIVVWVLYLLFAGVICLFFFKKYFNVPDVKLNKNKESDVKESVGEHKTENESHNENKKTVVKEKIIKKKSNLTIIVLKTIIFIFFSLPIFFVNLALISAITIVIYFMIKGLFLYSLLAIFIGLILIFSNIDDSLRRLVDSRKVYVYPFFIGMILVIIGGLLAVEGAYKLEYNNYLPTHNFKITEETVNIKLDKKLYIDDDFKYEIIIDNSLSSNNAIVKIAYYNQIIKINKNLIEKNNKYNLDIRVKSVKSIATITDIIIDNVKKDKLYRYYDFYIPTIKVYVNENNVNSVN